VVPDFVGNYAFSTLGNLVLNPRCGLLFLDFATGTTLQVAASAEVIWEGPEVASIQAAERLARFNVTGMKRINNAVPIRWTPVRTGGGSWSAK